jgi:hypothetical protein
MCVCGNKDNIFDKYLKWETVGLALVVGFRFNHLVHTNINVILVTLQNSRFVFARFLKPLNVPWCKHHVKIQTSRDYICSNIFCSQIFQKIWGQKKCCLLQKATIQPTGCLVSLWYRIWNEHISYLIRLDAVQSHRDISDGSLSSLFIFPLFSLFFMSCCLQSRVSLFSVLNDEP